MYAHCLFLLTSHLSLPPSHSLLDTGAKETPGNKEQQEHYKDDAARSLDDQCQLINLDGNEVAKTGVQRIPQNGGNHLEDKEGPVGHMCHPGTNCDKRTQMPYNMRHDNGFSAMSRDEHTRQAQPSRYAQSPPQAASAPTCSRMREHEASKQKINMVADNCAQRRPEDH